MDMKRLGYFARIAELGSVTEAANRFRISQPSLSRQMRLLEQELGVKLFVRHHRGMRLTPEGNQLYARLDNPLQQIERVLRDIRGLADKTQANLVFGVPPTVGYVLAGPLTRRLASQAPHISLRIVEAYAGNLASSIGRQEIDLALLYGPSSEWASMEWGHWVEGMLLEDLLVEDMVLVGPAECALDRERR